MRILRVLLALLLAAGPAQAQPVVDLLTRYSIPADETAASAPEGDAPHGSGKRLAALEADLALVSEGLEAFAHPQDADKALLAAKPRLPAGAAPFFRDRATALDALYRTLAVVDYTWALRFPDPPCAPAAKRSALLRSNDGLFMDTVSGKTSAWMAALLGPNAKGKDLESALDQASSAVTPSQAEYARLRARQNLITKALAAEGAVGSARSRLYCKRAETRAKLSAANRVTGPALAGRSSGEEVSRRGLVILAGKTSLGFEARGAGVAIETAAGIRVLTDRRLGTGEVAALVDGRSVPVPLSVEREDARSGLLLLRPDGDLGEALALAETAPKKDDLVFAFAHSERLGAWTKTQGLVTSAGPDQFLTDAVADASMTGGAVLDEEGNVAGLLVLRRAEGGAGEWPAAVPAPALWTWLAGGPAPDAVPVSLSDAGTTKILTASRPLLQSLAVGEGATAAGYGFDTQTQWGTVRATCMANCDDSSPSSSYSDNGSAELGQAMGKLLALGAEALIFKGVPALFRGIGSLFKSEPREQQAQTVKLENRPPPPPEPPKPECSFAAVDTPKTVAAEPVDLKVRFSCRYADGAKKIDLGGQEVVFTVGWEGAATSSTRTVTTDAEGYASLPLIVQSVESASQKAHDALDKYERDRTTPSNPPAAPAPLVGAVRDDGLINAASPGTASAEPAEKATTAPVARQAFTGATIILVRDETTKTALIAVGAKIRLGLVASRIIVAGKLGASFIVGWKIGKFALAADKEMNESLDKYNEAIDTRKYKQDKFDALDEEARAPREEEDECTRLARSGDTLARFVDRTSLAPQYLDAHEGVMGAHTKARHIRDYDYLLTRFPEYSKASSYDDQPTAERVIREAIENDLSGIESWITRAKEFRREIRYPRPGQPPIGFGATRLDRRYVRKTNVFVLLGRHQKCEIVIFSSYPE